MIAAVAWVAHGVALRSGLQALHGAALQRLEVEATRLDAELARFGYLPSLLETSPEVLRLLDEPANPALRESVNRYLKSLNSIAGAQSLYVLDRAGIALAAADAGQPGTPFGQDLSYRPYFRDALANGRGRFYGVGVTSGRAGYYLSYALPAQGPAHGVATVKVDLEAGEKAWRELPGEVLLLDEHEVVILASRPDWKYHPLARAVGRGARRGGAGTALWQRRAAAARLASARADWRAGSSGAGRRPRLAAQRAGGERWRAGDFCCSMPRRRRAAVGIWRSRQCRSGARQFCCCSGCCCCSDGARCASGWPAARRCRRRTIRWS